MVVAADPSGYIHAMWGNGPSLYYSQWDGKQWAYPIDVIAQLDVDRITWPSLTSDSDGNIYVCWKGPNSLLYYSYSSKGRALSARGWSETAVISHDHVMHSDIQIDMSGGIHVLYAVSGGDVYHIYSNNQGATWSSPTNVSVEPRNALTDYPRLAIDTKGRLHAAWTDYTAPDGEPVLGTFYAQSADSGQTWSFPMQVAAGRDYAEINVQTIGNDEIHLAWNGRVGFGGRYHQWSADGGQTWSAIEEIIPKSAQGGGRTGPPDMAVDSAGTLHLVSGMNPGGVMYVSWQEGRWSRPYLIQSPSEWAEKARIVVSEGNRLNIFWQEWYATSYTDAPHVVHLARPTVTPTVLPRSTETPQPVPVVTVQLLNQSQPQSANFGLGPLLAGALPVVLLVMVVVVMSRVRANSRRG